LKASNYDFTYSHDVSREQTRNSGSDNNNRLTVAFVSDETAHTRDNDQVLAIRSGPLSKKIVQDALLLTQDFLERESAEMNRIEALLKSQKDRQHTFNLKSEPNWLQGYTEVKTWIGEFSKNELLMSNAVTMDQIIRRVNNYNLHHPTEQARLALVLSGGGAKCAYQLGAVEVIEDKLEAVQRTNPKGKLGIDLVVGTSGGAINALTVAAEVTKDSNRRKDLKNTWESFGTTRDDFRALQRW